MVLLNFLLGALGTTMGIVLGIGLSIFLLIAIFPIFLWIREKLDDKLDI